MNNKSVCCPTFVGQQFFDLTMNKIFPLIVGLVFLLSGLLKAIDTASFADLMSQYGEIWFGYGAPIIILTEIILGILLLFNFYLKRITWTSVAFLVVVSLIYLYGVLAKGITDCGCFGPITWLNSKPWLSFTRNGVLLALLLPSLRHKNKQNSLTITSIIFMALIAVVVMFMCGFSMHGAKCMQKQNTFQPIPLNESPLASFVTCNPDSTYLVFAFSYACPYCQNSIGNVNQYTEMHAVDKVIGLALDDSLAQARFDRLFDVNFVMRNISQLEMIRLSTTLPVTYMIRHDTIISQYTGMVVSPALLIP